MGQDISTLYSAQQVIKRYLGQNTSPPVMLPIVASTKTVTNKCGLCLGSYGYLA